MGAIDAVSATSFWRESTKFRTDVDLAGLATLNLGGGAPPGRENPSRSTRR